jgi:arylsulfatase A
MKYFVYLSIVFFFSQCKPTEVTTGPNQTPNIIFILADDLGYGDVEILNKQSKIPTPHLNKLAQQGMIFTHAHAPSAVCTPTRYSVLTGNYSWRSPKKSGVAWLWDPPLIHKGDYTLGEMLQSKGYHTACIGKWHLGWHWPTMEGHSPQADGRNIDYEQAITGGPTELGFNYYFGDDVPSFPPHAFIENDKVTVLPTEWWEAGKAGAPGAMVPGWRYEDLLPTISEKAIKYVADRTINHPKEPFFLFFSLSAPHTPIAPSEFFLGSSGAGNYGDFVVEIDHYIGALLDTLDQLGISDQTLVIFTSDNGPTNMDGKNYVGEIGSVLAHGHNSAGIFRGLKSDSWEAGHREPFFARWPGVIPEASTSDALISLTDMFSTLASIVGFDPNDSMAVDSFDIFPLLNGSSTNIRENLIVQSGNGILSLIEGDWKIITSSGGGGIWSQKGVLAVQDTLMDKWQNVQLYNLSEDPAEAYNRADIEVKRVNEMMHKLSGQIRNGRSTAGTQRVNQGVQVWETIKWIESIP